MVLIKKFEDMIAWQKARNLSNLIYSYSNKNNFEKDFALKDQIRKSAISIMSNIAEGFERNSKMQLKYFLNIAKGSSGELRSQLYIARDQNYISEEQFHDLTRMTVEISKILNKFIRNSDTNITLSTFSD